MSKVLITTVGFGQVDRLPFELLDDANIDYVINPFNKKLTEEQLIELITDYDAIIAGTEKITEKVMEKATDLKFISRVGVGLDGLDLLAAERHKIAVSYTPDAPAAAVIDLTIGLMFSLLRKLQVSNMSMHDGVWDRGLGRRVADCAAGIIGVGRVGSGVIKILQALGCKKIMYFDEHIRLGDESESLVFSDKNTIYSSADIISIHVPLNPKTKDMITANEFKLMKRDVSLINTSRGGIINEDDLKNALENKIIGGAAIDVFTNEPYSGDLSKHNNCILTPHIGSMTFDCRSRMEIEATKEIVRFFSGDVLEGLVPPAEYDIRRPEHFNLSSS